MKSLVRPATQLFAVLFALLGIAAFFTNDLLFDFRTDIVQNVIHIITGIAGLWAAANSKERLYLLVFGLFYALCAILGFVNYGDVMGLFDANQTEATIYGVVAVIFIVLGSSKKK